MERREKRATYTGVKIGVLAFEVPIKNGAEGVIPAVPVNKKKKQNRREYR